MNGANRRCRKEWFENIQYLRWVEHVTDGEEIGVPLGASKAVLLVQLAEHFCWKSFTGGSFRMPLATSRAREFFDRPEFVAFIKILRSILI